MPDPLQQTDDTARALAIELLETARSAALGSLSEDFGPVVTRIGFAWTKAFGPVTLISALAAHTGALRMNPACSLLVGDPGPKGDPLMHPRLTLLALARFIPRDGDEYEQVLEQYLSVNPKARLYAGLGDFSFVRLQVRRALLNGGFGKAYHLKAADLGLKEASE